MTEDNASNLANEVISRLDDIFRDDDDEMIPVETLATATPPNAETPSQEADSSEPPAPLVSFETEEAEASSEALDSYESIEPAASEPVPSTPPAFNAGNPSPLVELNAIVLSLDWEISDETLDRLLNEIDRLMAMFAEDKLLYMFLQLLSSIGKYISSKKVKAHPDSIKLLHSVFAGLDRVLNTPSMADVEKKRILVNEIRQFKNLKERIRSARIESPKENSAICEPVKDQEPAMPEDNRGLAPRITEPPLVETSPEALATAIVAEMQKVIKAEFAILKDEIKQLLSK